VCWGQWKAPAFTKTARVLELPLDQDLLVAREGHLHPSLTRCWCVYEGAPNAPALATTTFNEADGRTTLAILARHTSLENRDAHLNSGMESGTNESLDLLEQVALSLQ
jgi:hypothetical protein